MKPALPTPTEKPSRLWIWVLVACLLHVGTWVLWITIGAMHPVQEVPVVHLSR